MGLRQPEIFRFESGEYPVQLAAAPAVAAAPMVAVAVPATEAEAPRYERSGLGVDEATRLADALRTMMEHDRPWTDSEMTRAGFAMRLETTPHKLSEVLNGGIGQTFYDS